MQELEAVVRSAGVFFLWVVDVNEPPPGGSKDHYIVYDDIRPLWVSQVCKIPDK